MAEDNKIRLTKEGQQDRMVTQSQAQPFLDRGFTMSENTAPIQTPTAPLGQEAAFEFAQRLPQPSPTITPENLGTSQPITLPESQLPDATSGDAILTSATTNIDQIMKSLEPTEVSAEQTKEQNILDVMAELTGGLGQKGAEQLSLEQKSQLPQLRQQFAELNSKILEKNAEFETLKQSYEQANLIEEGKPQTLSRLQGAQARNYRMFLAQKNALAAEAGFLQAQAQGLQGRITDAQNTVNRAIDLKYSTIQSQLNTYQAQLNAIQPELNRQEQRRATAQQILLNNQLRELEDKKESEKQIQSVMFEAISNGINDTEVLAQISNAIDYNQALRILGANMPEPEDESVLDLQARYPDAGISATDTFEQASAKLPNSRIYRQQTRLAGGGGGGGSTVRPQTLPETPEEVKEVLSGLSSIAQDVYENPALLDNFTPTEKGKIIKELSGAGLDLEEFTVEKVNAAQRTQIAQYDDLIRQGQSAGEFLEETGLDTGPIASRVKSVQAAFGGAQDFTTYRGIIDNMSSALLKLRSGAAVTPQEYERIKGFIPTPLDDERTAKTKIFNFYTELDTARDNYIKRATQTEQQILESVDRADTPPKQTNFRLKYNY